MVSEEIDKYELFNECAKIESKKSLKKYLHYLISDTRPPKRIELLWENNKWQKDLYYSLVPFFELAAGFKVKSKRNLWVQAPKGYSKTTTIAEFLIWALCYSKHPIIAVVGARDKIQSNTLLDRMKFTYEHNKWLPELTFIHYEVRSVNGSKLTVLSSDADSFSGALPDIIIAEELVFWQKQDLWDQFIAATQKRPNCVLVVLTNAGVFPSWQYEAYEIATKSDEWMIHNVPANSASWPTYTPMQKQMMPPQLFKRLHLNEWISNAEFSETYKPDWFNFYDEHHDRYILGDTVIRKEWLNYIITTDLAMSMKQDADYTVAQVWGITPHNYMLLIEQWKDRKEAPQIIAAFKHFLDKYKADCCYIEEVQGQAYILQIAAQSGLRVKGIKPDGKDKKLRASVSICKTQAGQVWLPKTEWIKKWVDDMCNFGNTRHDDEFDAFSYAGIVASHYPVRMLPIYETEEEKVERIKKEKHLELLKNLSGPDL